MIEAIVLTVVTLTLLGGLYALYKWGQSSQETKERQRDLKEAADEADILVRQRDGGINTVDDADRLFDDYASKHPDRS